MHGLQSSVIAHATCAESRVECRGKARRKRSTGHRRHAHYVDISLTPEPQNQAVPPRAMLPKPPACLVVRCSFHRCIFKLARRMTVSDSLGALLPLLLEAPIVDCTATAEA